eukprot:scaffold2445_cov205-Alexandrium_tamarense.AAC.28
MQISSNHISHPQLTPKEGAYKGCKRSNGKRSITTPTHNNAPITWQTRWRAQHQVVGYRVSRAILFTPSVLSTTTPTESCRRMKRYTLLS